jgi:hypothetical protein
MEGPMAKNTAKPVTAVSRTAARLSLAGAAVFLVLLAALHFIKPEFDPSWRVISEYALGDYGWIMVLAFLCLAFSCVTLFIVIRSQTRTIGGKIGLAFLLVSAAGLTIAAIFTTDPLTASQDELTTHGNLHALGAALGTGFPIAATLIARSLARNQAWSSARRSLIWAAVLAWIGFLVFALSMAVMFPDDGTFGPDVLIGWPNRFMMLANSVWLMVVAWQAIRVRDTWVPGSGREGVVRRGDDRPAEGGR